LRGAAERVIVSRIRIMDWEQLTIDLEGLDCDALLSDWRWLMPAGLHPVSLTVFGDWFFEDADGHVLFLDTAA